jgi:hypothetical protein
MVTLSAKLLTTMVAADTGVVIAELAKNSARRIIIDRVREKDREWDIEHCSYSVLTRLSTPVVA